MIPFCVSSQNNTFRSLVENQFIDFSTDTLNFFFSKLKKHISNLIFNKNKESLIINLLPILYLFYIYNL